MRCRQLHKNGEKTGVSSKPQKPIGPSGASCVGMNIDTNKFEARARVLGFWPYPFKEDVENDRMFEMGASA